MTPPRLALVSPPTILLLLLLLLWGGARPGGCKPAVPRGALSRGGPPRPPEAGTPEGDPATPVLGVEEALAFGSLGPEQSKQRLAVLVERMDSDGDGLVSRAELRAWIAATQRRQAAAEVARHWADYDADRDDHVSWHEYRSTTYGGYLEDAGGDAAGVAGGDAGQQEEDEERRGYRRMVARDRRRFSVADGDADGRMTRDEFSAFLHPDEHEHMADIVVTETIEDLDKNGDGMIDVEEYIGDMYQREAGEGGEAGEEEPPWVVTAREQFRTLRDADGDGRMGREETRAWLRPGDYDHADIEAQHLVHHSDADADGKLSSEEILNKMELFVGSQATNFGEDLNRHDEF